MAPIKSTLFKAILKFCTTKKLFTKIESSRSDKKARKFIEAHVDVKDSRFEIPVTLKTGVVAIPDNMAVAKNRLENLKKKAFKDTDLREFFT